MNAPAAVDLSLRSRRTVDSSRPLRVMLAGKLDALTAPGGGETQLLSTVAALRAIGVEASLWRPWEDRLADADWLHLFGSEPEHLQVTRLAQRAGVRVAISTIAWFELADCWREPWAWPKRLAAATRFITRAAAPRLPSWRRSLYRNADLLLPNSMAEARQLERYFAIPRQKMAVIPNGADPRFVRGDAAPFSRLADMRDFVLYAGRIEPRKNQLVFLQATRDLNLPTVVLGDAPPGHEDYARACHRAAGPRVRFVPRLHHASEMLASAYAACRVLALASWYETPGLVALEAAMSGVPLVLPQGGCAREYFGDMAQYVSPDDRQDIAAKVKAAYAAGRSGKLALHVRENFSWEAAARATLGAYLAATTTEAASC